MLFVPSPRASVRRSKKGVAPRRLRIISTPQCDMEASSEQTSRLKQLVIIHGVNRGVTDSAGDPGHCAVKLLQRSSCTAPP